jgi:hypothetical protein
MMCLEPFGAIDSTLTDTNLKKLKLGLVGFAIAGFAVLGACGKSEPPANRSVPSQPAQLPPASQPSTPPLTPVESVVIEKNSPFNHNTKAHQQDCAVCHQRIDNEPVPDFPSHPACIDCHQKDFTSTTSQMCAVCHQAPLDREPKLISFPSKMSEFGIKGFSHKAHMDPAKMPAGTQPLKCDSCHRFGGRGVEASFPRHAECYSCHTHQAGEKLGECSTCHTGASEAMKYRAGSASALSQYNFRHATHTKRTSCERCHRVTAPVSAKQADVQRMSTSRGQRHRSGCWSCHVQARESVCSKCHTGGVPFSG